MNIQILHKRKHMFKSRKIKNYSKKKNLRYGTAGLQILKQIRYELVYLRALKKTFKQKHIRGRIIFFKAKFWIFLKPNYILSAKSTNARMGAGTGSLVRISILIKAYRIFIETRGFSPQWMSGVYNKLRYRYPFYIKAISR